MRSRPGCRIGWVENRLRVALVLHPAIQFGGHAVDLRFGFQIIGEVVLLVVVFGEVVERDSGSDAMPFASMAAAFGS